MTQQVDELVRGGTYLGFGVSHLALAGGGLLILDPLRGHGFDGALRRGGHHRYFGHRFERVPLQQGGGGAHAQQEHLLPIVDHVFRILILKLVHLMRMGPIVIGIEAFDVPVWQAVFVALATKLYTFG